MVTRRIIATILFSSTWFLAFTNVAHADPCTERLQSIGNAAVQGNFSANLLDDPDCDKGAMAGTAISWGAAVLTAVTAIAVGLGAPAGASSAASSATASATTQFGSLPGTTRQPPQSELTEVQSGQQAMQTLQGLGIVEPDPSRPGVFHPREPFWTNWMNTGQAGLTSRTVGESFPIDPVTGKPAAKPDSTMSQTITGLGGIAYNLNPNGTLDPNIAIVVNVEKPGNWVPTPTAAPPVTTSTPTTPTTPTTTTPTPSGGGAPGGSTSSPTSTGPVGGGADSTTPPVTPPVKPPVVPTDTTTLVPPPTPPTAPPVAQTPPKPAVSQTAPPSQSSTPPPAGTVNPQTVDWAANEGKNLFNSLSPDDKNTVLQTARTLINQRDPSVQITDFNSLVNFARDQTKNMTPAQAQQALTQVQQMLGLASVGRVTYAGATLMGSDRIAQTVIKTAVQQTKLPANVVKGLMEMDDQQWDALNAFVKNAGDRLGK